MLSFVSAVLGGVASEAAWEALKTSKLTDVNQLDKFWETLQ